MSDIRRNRRRLRLATGIAGSVALFGAGTALGGHLAEDGARQGEGVPLSSVRTHDLGRIAAGAPQEQAERLSLASRVDVAAAVRAALARTPGRATAAALESEQGSLVWEVEVLDHGGRWHGLTVDAGNAAVVRRRTDGGGGGSGATGEAGAGGAGGAQNARLAEAAEVTLTEAARGALAAVAGRVGAVSLESRFEGRRRLNWAVTVQDHDGRVHGVCVDAVGGEVLRDRVAAS
ncbi:PepSY domain-containing protein [Streptomyces polyrhachis]|uniref:PepSY domain-containing protein n=1 Tax=Streptomyces polyrhachis TaxID=1282885 RepID=A0ABW2G8G7_9ACTN